MIQPLWKTVWRFFKKLGIKTPYDPAIPLLGIYFEETRICLQCGRTSFDPWVGKIPWRRERLPTPVFWPGEFHGLYSPRGCKESDTTERLSL